MKRFLLIIFLANFLFIWGAVTKNYYLLIPLNFGIVWGFLNKKNEANQ